MKKILLIMPYGSVGGMERLALTFYNHYKSKGYLVKALKIIKLESDIIHFGEDELSLSTVDFSGMPSWKRMLFYFDAPIQIRKIIMEHNITHSIAFGDMANVFSSLTFTKEFKIASIHSFKSVEFKHPDFLGKIFKLAYKTSYYNFDKVVCISNTIRKDLIENCGYKFPDNLEVIYNPHDIAAIEKLSSEPLDANESNIFENDVILFLGRLTIPKAPWHLIKAFSLVLKEKSRVKLVFVGDGNDDVTDYVKNLISKLGLSGNIVLMGRRNNPYKYLKKAKVTALSSYYEGTPNVIVESIALEVPIVSSNSTGGILELMGDGSETENHGVTETVSGLITPTFFKGEISMPESDAITSEEVIFANALLSVLENEKYKRSLLASKAALLKKFDLEDVAAQYLEKIQR